MIAQVFAEKENQRQWDKARSFAEINGTLMIDINGISHRITARADRIDSFDDGALTIIDYKTGQPPSKAQVQQGRSLQLRVEALIAADGGFDDLQGLHEINAMHYWQVSGKRSLPIDVKNVTPDDSFVTETRQGIEALLTAFQQPQQGYRAEPLAREANRYSDYRHLARVAEWGTPSDEEGDGE